VLAGLYAFDAFVVADTLAFLCSSLATFAIIYAGSPAICITLSAETISNLLSFCCMVQEEASGLFGGLHPT
jgi:hypothetical protein